MSQTTDLAFLGMGVMGAPMALNLHRAGHRLACFNRTPAPGSSGLQRVIEACPTAPPR